MARSSARPLALIVALATLAGVTAYSPRAQAGAAPSAHVQTTPCAADVPAPAVCDRTLGVALTLPAGWSVAPPRQFTPGSLTFVTSLKTMALRFSIQPLGIADTRSPADPIAAAAAGVAALTQGLTTRARNFPVTVAGLPAVMLLDMPGPGPTMHVVIAHGDALYDIVAFGGATLQPDQQQALSSVRFIPPAGPFPPAGAPQPSIAALRDPCVDLEGRAPAASASGAAPARLRLTYNVAPARGNDMVVSHVAGTGVRPGERVALTICSNTGTPPIYTRYQVTLLMATVAGDIDTDAALFVPSGTFGAWTVRVIAVDAATGRLVATATRMGRAPTPAHGLRLQARSRHVATGRPYPFRLYTHCGVDFATDFDGSFWDLADAAWAGSYGNPPSAIGNPFQDGAMTLVDHDHARFDVPRDPVDPVRFPGGPIRFTRHVGPTVVPGYCS